MKWSVVAWCDDCGFYLEAHNAGELCPIDICERRLRKRVGYIDKESEMHDIYFRSEYKTLKAAKRAAERMRGT